MANRTDPNAATVHGTNPQNLVEKIVRSKIYDCQYWKEHCFGLTAESLIDKAVGLRAAGGTFGGARKPCEFMCLTLKLLQIQPDKDIIIEYIKNDEFKYVRMLGAFYLRLVGKPLDVYNYLEPLLSDFRKVRLRNLDGTFELSHMDEVVDKMLHSDLLFDIALPRIPHRHTLEKIGQLDPYVSAVDLDADALEAELGAAQEEAAAMEVEAPSPPRSRSRSRSRDRKEERAREKWRDRDSTRRVRDRDVEAPAVEENGHGGDRHRDHDRHHDRDHDGEKDRHHERDRDRDRDRDRENDRHRDREHERRRPRSRSRDRERGGRDRDRDRDAERGKDRDRGREQGREREGDRDRRRRRSRSGSRERPHRKEARREGGRRGRDEDLPPPPAGGGGSKDEMSVDQTNAMRSKLGLAPLKQ